MSFYLPYKKGERPIYYKGKVEDKTEIVGAEELQNMMVEPFKNMPPGGAPMGGGSSLGGSPMGGGMGGAPMGGGSPLGGSPMGGGI